MKVAGPRTFHNSLFPAERIEAERDVSISLCLPARNEVETIGEILRSLVPLLEHGVVDQVVVMDESSDGTGELARELGAEVYRQSELRPEFGPVSGKGDALWRSLSVLRGDVVCFLDADSRRFGAHFACGLVGAVACERDVVLAKGCYRRPFCAGGIELPEGGGRVTELMARPLLSFFYPELAGFLQPLAGEVAARKELLHSLPFVTNYGVDIALLIDTWRGAGIERLVQVDLDVRQNRHKRLCDLVPMAGEVLDVVLSRLVREERLSLATDNGFLVPFAGGDAPMSLSIDERPPFAAVAVWP
jgi:glucosyl-3-phosphoglycerate synthase